MLLVQLKVNNVTKRISNEPLNLEHRWHPYIESFSSPQIQVATDYGGFGRLGFGSITILPTLFVDDWPPPVQCGITVQYTASTEAAAVTLFSSTAHLNSYSRDQVTYDIQELEYDIDLLTEVDDYDGNTVALPKAFGTVTHVTPVRLPDVDIGGGYGYAPTYHLGGVSATNTAKRIIGFSYHDATHTKVHIGDVDGDPVAHGYSTNDSIVITNSTNYNGTYTIGDATGNTTFTIVKAFTTDEESLPMYAYAYEVGSVCVFDGGYPIPENFYNNGDGTFSLMAVPVGQVTISGTASQTTLSEIFTWGYAALGIANLTTTYARSPSPPVNAWVTSQQPLVDFLSEVAASTAHIYYIDIDTDTLHLVDMYANNGTATLTEFSFFEQVEYGRFAPVKKVSAEWTTYSAECGFASDDDVTQSLFIKDTDHEISEAVYDYGSEMSITPYHDDEAIVRARLVMVKNLMKKDKITIKLPFSASLPALGERLSWTDSSVPTDIPGYLRARIIAFDFDASEVRITGEGEILQCGDMGALVDSSTEIVDSFDQGLAHGAYWEFVVTDAGRANMRVGIIGAVWDQSNDSAPEVFPENSSGDIGDTSDITFTVDKSGSTVRLRAVCVGTWTVIGHRRMIWL